MRSSLRGIVRLALLASVLTVCVFGQARADSAHEIDQRVDAALARFREKVEGADEFLAKAKGVLVEPEVKKAGLVVAGQWGQGALRVGGKSVGYYKMEVGSAGFQAGYQKADFVFIFLTDEALKSFQEGKGWTAGAESGITLVEKGMGVSADTLKSKTPVMGFIFGRSGLMAGFSLKGAKFSQFFPK